MRAAERRRFQRVRWTMYSLLAASYMAVFFHRMVPGVVSADLMLAFHTTGAALGSLAAMYYYIYTAMQLPAGVLADTLGPRVTVAVGALIAGAGSILFGLAPDFAAAALGRLLVGLGLSVVFVGLMRANTVWFSEHQYGLISGLTLFIGNLGSILAAGPLAVLLDLYSWRDVFVGAGIASLALALLTFAFVRNRPEDAGFPSLRELQGKAAHPPRHRHWAHDLNAVVRARELWPGFWAHFGLTGSLFAFAGLWGLPLVRDVFGLTRTAAALYTTATLAGFALGALGLGWFSDRVGRRKPVIVAAAVASCLLWLALIVLPWGPGVSGFALYFALGLVTGGFVVIYAAAKEAAPPAIAGMAIAMVNTGLFLGAAMMQPAFGWALDLTWNGVLRDGVRVYTLADYRNGLWLSLGFALLGTIASLFVRETYCRNVTLAGR